MTQLWHEERLLVNSNWVEAGAALTFPTVNRATEAVLGRAAGGVEGLGAVLEITTIAEPAA
jgi:hypothetical protein